MIFELLLGSSGSNGDSSGSAKELMSELVHLYDVVVEDTETDSRPANAQSSDVDKKEGLAGPGGGGVGSHIGMEMAVSSAAKPREGAITCNSTEMIREKHHYANGRLTVISAIVLKMTFIPGNLVTRPIPSLSTLHADTEKLGMDLGMRLNLGMK